MSTLFTMFESRFRWLAVLCLLILSVSVSGSETSSSPRMCGSRERISQVLSSGFPSSQGQTGVIPTFSSDKALLLYLNIGRAIVGNFSVNERPAGMFGILIRLHGAARLKPRTG